MVSSADETVVLLCLFSGLILFALDAVAGRRLDSVLSTHKKAALVSVGALCAVLVVGCAAVFLHTGPYTFKTDDSYVTYLLPEGTTGEVTITGDLDADPRTEIYSQSKLDGIYGNITYLYEGPFSKCTFTVPEDAVNVYVTIGGQAGETIRSLSVNGGDSITLSYPWLPEVISTRLLRDSLLRSKSFTLRGGV